MSRDCCDTRRSFLKRALGLGASAVGLNLVSALHAREAYGITPNPGTQRYDAVIQIFYSGAPSQTDTWDPADPGSTSNYFNTINLGVNDIYGQPFRISEVFPNLANLVMNDPAVGLGAVRSMTHGNGSHESAQEWMNCFWQSPVADVYPSTAASMNHYFQGQGLGVGSVLINGSNGDQANSAKGGQTGTAYQVFSLSNADRPLRRPVSAERYTRRRDLIQAFNRSFLPGRPDAAAGEWDAAWKQAYDITTQGTAANAFDLTGKTLLPGGPTAPSGDIQRLTMCQELVKAGVPYVAMGIGGNDTHTGNSERIRRNWGDTTDVAVARMAQNLKATGKRVLILMGGEFGRTPNTSKPDGRDHWASGFSWAMLSINQPAFRTTAVGDTGPDGTWTVRSATKLVDPVEPSALGGFVYQALGFPIASDPKWNVPTAVGVRPPVDQDIALSTAPGGGRWLMQQFGVA